MGQSHTINAEFAGNDSYNPSSGSSTLTIAQSTTSLTGENLTATAGISVQLGAKLIRLTDKAPLAGRTIGFYDALGTNLIGTATTDLTGRATIVVTAPDVGITDKYVVKFAGDTNYAGSNGTASVKGQ